MSNRGPKRLAIVYVDREKEPHVRIHGRDQQFIAWLHNTFQGDVTVIDDGLIVERSLFYQELLPHVWRMQRQNSHLMVLGVCA